MFMYPVCATNARILQTGTVQDWYCTCIWLLEVLVIPSLTVIRGLPPGTPVSLSFKPLGYLVSLSVPTHGPYHVRMRVSNLPINRLSQDRRMKLEA